MKSYLEIRSKFMEPHEWISNITRNMRKHSYL